MENFYSIFKYLLVLWVNGFIQFLQIYADFFMESIAAAEDNAAAAAYDNGGYDGVDGGNDACNWIWLFWWWWWWWIGRNFRVFYFQTDTAAEWIRPTDIVWTDDSRLL